MSIINEKWKEWQVKCDCCDEIYEFIFDSWQDAADWENLNFNKIKIDNKWFGLCDDICLKKFRNKCRWE